MKPELLISLLILTLGCKIVGQEDEFIYGKIYVNSIVVDDSVKFGETFTVKIYGSFPTPGWQIFKHEINETESKIEITPIARIRKDIIVPQVLTPCSTSVELLCKTKSDSLKIVAVGRTSKIEKTVRVVK
ncbi:hypothetical protein JGI1_00963 [Candidatus Thermokryptus mobilis]|uniref:Uncharacterized protein n=1 Tax=Candidatus Thermokryptus mobilis TaxID=1643428 RepID=A0A0S4N2H6_9BACT|nr:hypothetical protein [Candidatus Thermokryptus mobilis]CUU04319.1 hypothetical protein JGI1_00963 [Candidatus Thermokryptus mobilis]